MKRILFVTLTLSLLLLVFVACSQTDGPTTAVSTQAPVPTSTSTSAATSATLPDTTSLPCVTASASTTPTTTYAPLVYDTAPIPQEDGEPMALSWNPYLVSPFMREAGEEYVAGTKALITAVLNHRTAVTFSSASVMQAVCDNFFYEFPPAALVTLTPDSSTQTVTLTYTLEREAHLAAIAAFEAQIKAAIAETLLAGDSEAVKALLLYHYVSTHVTYFTVDYSPWQTNAYYALTQGKSICYGFADLYNYLLRQVGIDAYLVKGIRRSDRADHAWSLLKIDGQWYHADPTWESSAFDGVGFMYFGQTDAMRDGILAIEALSVGSGSLEHRLLPKAEDTRFSEIGGDRIFRPTWVLDRENETITFTTTIFGLTSTKVYSFAATKPS